MITRDGKCTICGDRVAGLACPKCIAARDAKVQRQFQAQYVLRAVAGEIELRLHRDDKNVKHIKRWGSDRTFCDIELSPQSIRRRRYQFWEPENLTDLCPDCVKVFDSLAQEGMRPPAA